MPKLLIPRTSVLVSKKLMPSGKWRIKIELPHVDGVRQKPLYAPMFSGTDKEAERRCWEVEVEQNELLAKLAMKTDHTVANATVKTHITPVVPKAGVVQLGATVIPLKQLTVRAWGEAWLEAQKYRDLSATTLAAYAERLETVYRIWGDIPLVKLSHDDVIGGFNQLAAEGRTGRGPHNIRDRLKALVLEAINRDIIAKDPTRDLQLQQAQPGRKARALTPHDWTQMLDVLRTHRLGWTIRTMLGSGIRPGEAAGLEWRHIDWDAGSLRVAQTLSGRNNRKLGTTTVISEPKTKSSKRVITLGDKILNSLRTKYDEVALKYVALGLDPEKQPVFLNNNGERWLPKSLNEAIKIALGKKVDLAGITAHGMRHIHATELLRSGHNPRAVSDRLGHADKALVLTTYGHILPADDKTLAASMDGKLG